MVRWALLGRSVSNGRDWLEVSVSDTGIGMTAVSYLLAGMLVWGGIGWLVDHWVGTRGIFAGLGAVLGMAGGVYLIVRRLGA